MSHNTRIVWFVNHLIGPHGHLDAFDTETEAEAFAAGKPAVIFQAEIQD